MKLFDRVKFLFRNNWEELIADYRQKFFAGELVGKTDQLFSQEYALKYHAVFACCRVLSETLACLPCKIYLKTDKGRDEIKNMRLTDILQNVANEEMTAYNFKEAMMMSLNLGGNSVSEKILNYRNEVIGLYPYPHSMVEIKRDKNTGKLIYEIDNKESTPKTLRRDQVLHVPGLSLDGIQGLSPISYASTAIKLGNSYDKFGENFYKNGLISSGAFEFPKGFTDKAFQRLKKDVNKNYTGMINAGTPLILEEGGTFKPFTINPVDAQMIESKKMTIQDIARIYRVPMHLIQELSRSTNNNIEKQSLEFVMYTMLPWAKRIEDNLKAQLLTPYQRNKGIYLEFKMDVILRGDLKSRYEAYTHARNWGWMSANDIRRLENMNSIENGDIYLTPLNMVEAGSQDLAQQQTDDIKKEIDNMFEERGY